MTTERVADCDNHHHAFIDGLGGFFSVSGVRFDIADRLMLVDRFSGRDVFSVWHASVAEDLDA